MPPQPECDHCEDHGETRTLISIIKDDMKQMKEDHQESLKKLQDGFEIVRARIREERTRVDQNEKDMSRRISDRIPIRHAIAVIVIAVSVITGFVSYFAWATNNINDKLASIDKAVAVSIAVNEERKDQLNFQQQLLSMFLNVLQRSEKNDKILERRPYSGGGLGPPP